MQVKKLKGKNSSFFVKSKKGFLLGEYTLKVLIAALCIALLVYFLFRIYGIYEDDKDLNQAEATLNDIFVKMNLAKQTNQVQTLVLLEPATWVVANFKKGEERPISCTNNCICICSGRDSFLQTINFRSQLTACEKQSKCKEIADEVSDFMYQIRIQTPHIRDKVSAVNELEIKYENNQFVFIGK